MHTETCTQLTAGVYIGRRVYIYVYAYTRVNRVRAYIHIHAYIQPHRVGVREHVPALHQSRHSSQYVERRFQMEVPAASSAIFALHSVESVYRIISVHSYLNARHVQHMYVRTRVYASTRT